MKTVIFFTDLIFYLDDNSPKENDARCCLKGGSKICGAGRVGDYSSYGGIDGGNASCSYPSSSSDVIKPLLPSQVQEMEASISSVASSSPGGVNGGAGGTSASTSTLGLPSTSSAMDATESVPRVDSAYDVPYAPDASPDVMDDTTTTPGDQSEWKTCNICLEEMALTELKSHGLCYDCLLCESCLDMSCKHHGGDTLPCPVCQTSLTRASLIPVAKRQTLKPKPRLLRVCVVFRLDADSQDNNKRHTMLLGHPRLLSLPSRLPLSLLHSAISHCVPPEAEYNLLLVDGRVSRVATRYNICHIVIKITRD